MSFVQGIFGAAVYGETENKHLRHLIMGTLAVKIGILFLFHSAPMTYLLFRSHYSTLRLLITLFSGAAPWEMSNYVYIRRGKKKLILYPVQFELDTICTDEEIQCNCQIETSMIARCQEPTPLGSPPNCPITLSFKSCKRQGDNWAVVPRNKRGDDYIHDIPPEVRESIKRIVCSTD